MGSHAWWAGLTCDHLYPDCPSRLNAERSLRLAGWWDNHQPSGVDPDGELVCGMCHRRWSRSLAQAAS